jgi:YHS domain-containing protein
LRLNIRPRAIWNIALCAVVIATALRAVAEDPPDNGVWKFAPAPEQIHGESNNEDPVGVAAGKHLKTDCSINWTADNGKVYCFTTRTSMEFFEDSPRTYLSAAQ